MSVSTQARHRFRCETVGEVTGKTHEGRLLSLETSLALSLWHAGSGFGVADYTKKTCTTLTVLADSDWASDQPT